MGKKIYVDFPESKIRVVADLCEETEPEMCEILWNTIKDQPLRMACMHTMSTGHFFDAKIRPSASPVKSGTQANPVGRSAISRTSRRPAISSGILSSSPTHCRPWS